MPLDDSGAPHLHAGGTGVIAVIGEALVDLMPHGARDVLLVVPGGSPANVCVGLARLEVPVGFIARFGHGSLAQQIRSHLLGKPAAKRTSIAIVGIDPGSEPLEVVAGVGHVSKRIYLR